MMSFAFVRDVAFFRTPNLVATAHTPRYKWTPPWDKTFNACTYSAWFSARAWSEANTASRKPRRNAAGEVSPRQPFVKAITPIGSHNWAARIAMAGLLIPTESTYVRKSIGHMSSKAGHNFATTWNIQGRAFARCR